MPHRRRIAALGSTVLLASATWLLAGSPAHAADQATVSVLHGVPDATVDVYVNGDALLENFEPGTLTDPVSLDAGSYDIKIVKAGDGGDGQAVVEADDVAVPAGANITVVAHLDADGAPALTPYVNDVSRVPAGQARLTVRHDAAAPAVDVRAGGDPVFTDLTNPNEKSAEVDAGTVEADVVLAGTETVAIGPADLDLAEGTSTIVYAWGSAEDDNLKLAVQTIDDLHSAPGGVPGGTGGQAAQLGTSGADPVLLGLLGVGVVGVAAAAIGVRRSQVAASRTR